jgi:2,3-bisphosphoglycerate-independent phosphoglycerate mutase
MKYALIIPDGAGDEPIAEFDDQTPLAAARTPNMDWISISGRQGTVVTVPEVLPPQADVATLSLLGYDPNSHRTGRAPLEALAAGIELAPTDLVFRCNLVTIVDGRMADFSAGRIGDSEAAEIVRVLNEQVAPDGMRFHPTRSYRNLLIVSGGVDLDVECTPPHAFPGQPAASHLPRGRDAERIRSVMDQASVLLSKHEINDVRRDLGENPATGIWLWGQGRAVSLPSFDERFQTGGGAAIAAVDLVRGLAAAIGLKVIDVPGATGYLDTDYQSKGNAAVAALDDVGFALVHVGAPDGAGHLGDATAKVKSLEQVDEHVVGPVLDRIRSFDTWKIMVAPACTTPATRRVHTPSPAPFCVAGDAVHAVLASPFSEANADASDLHCDPGHELMEYFLKR